jgi:hypothetical protein
MKKSHHRIFYHYRTRKARNISPEPLYLLSLTAFSGIIFIVSKEKDAPENNTFAETISLLDELRDEFVLLESIRQTAKELCEMKNIATSNFIDKLHELRQLVITD